MLKNIYFDVYLIMSYSEIFGYLEFPLKLKISEAIAIKHIKGKSENKTVRLK